MQILNWQQLNKTQRIAALARPAPAYNDAQSVITKIMQNVAEQDDTALRNYTQQFDGIAINEFEVSAQEFAAANAQLTDKTRAALELAAANIERFHAAQLPSPVRVETIPGVVCETRPWPLQTVGFYVPAGSAPLPSSVLMQAIPARLAGCPQKVLCTPPRKDGTVDPVILAAAQLCGVDRVFKLGGAQAVAAMAYGTKTVPRVDKIFGPGNSWVTAAKQYVANAVDPRLQGVSIDMPAGPSEVLVIADAEADAEFIAADLLSQAEHGPDSQVMLLTSSQQLLDETQAALEQQLEYLPRAAIACEALQKSRAILVPDIKTAFAVSNRYAPEHLIVQLDNAREWLDAIRNAGSVFLGAWTPESLGDYVSGTNHVLPTAAYARSLSGLTVNSFMKTLLVQEAQPQGLGALSAATIELANVEGLQAHANAVQVRLNKLQSLNAESNNRGPGNLEPGNLEAAHVRRA